MKTIRTNAGGYKHMVECFMCESDFQFGPGIYDGRGIGAWGISVCRGCYNTNDDGIVLEIHPKLLAHLKERGVDIKLNRKGWLDWPP